MPSPRIPAPTPAAQVGLLIYPDCQLAAVHGLTDLFRIAGEWAAKAAGEGPAPFIRVSHWTASEDEGRVACTWDSRPGAPHALTQPPPVYRACLDASVHTGGAGRKWAYE